VAAGTARRRNWTWSNNICNFGASQGVMIEAVQNVTIRNNLFNGKGDKAIGHGHRCRRAPRSARTS